MCSSISLSWAVPRLSLVPFSCRPMDPCILATRPKATNGAVLHECVNLLRMRCAYPTSEPGLYDHHHHHQLDANVYIVNVYVCVCVWVQCVGWADMLWTRYLSGISLNERATSVRWQQKQQQQLQHKVTQLHNQQLSSNCCVQNCNIDTEQNTIHSANERQRTYTYPYVASGRARCVPFSDILCWKCWCMQVIWFSPLRCALTRSQRPVRRMTARTIITFAHSAGRHRNRRRVQFSRVICVTNQAQ